MNYLEFQIKMEPFKVFSVTDIEKMFPGFAWINLIKWQRKGYLKKIRREWYCFDSGQPFENRAWLAANLIYRPSYISIQTALAFYGLISETVFTITSVTVKKTNIFETPLGVFSYNKLKSGLFGFGHTISDYSLTSESVPGNPGRKILIAEPEKAILDFFYLYPQYKTEQDMNHLRFDHDTLISILDLSRFSDYLNRFDCKALTSRIHNFMKVYPLK